MYNSSSCHKPPIPLGSCFARPSLCVCNKSALARPSDSCKGRCLRIQSAKPLPHGHKCPPPASYLITAHERWAGQRRKVGRRRDRSPPSGESCSRPLRGPLLSNDAPQKATTMTPPHCLRSNGCLQRGERPGTR